MGDKHASAPATLWLSICHLNGAQVDLHALGRWTLGLKVGSTLSIHMRMYVPLLGLQDRSWLHSHSAAVTGIGIHFRIVEPMIAGCD